MALADDLLGIVEAARERMTVADHDLAVRIATRYADLTTRRLLGEDVEDELRIVRASANDIRLGVQGAMGNALAAKVRSHLLTLLAGTAL